MAPVVPGFTTQTSKLEATIKAVADHGAAFMGANVLYLKDGTRDHFMGFLAREFPHMVESYQRLYAGAYAAKDYVRTVRGLIDVLKQKHHVDHRTMKGEETEAAPADGSGGTGPLRLVTAAQALAANAWMPPAAGSTSISTRPSRTSATNACPCAHSWLIGSLISSSITRFRKRAP